MRKILFVFILIFAALILGRYNPLELKLKSGLQVTTNEVVSSLFLDDQYLDKTPFIDKKIQPKSYVLRIQPDDQTFVSYELPVELNKGLVTVVNWKPGLTLETSGGAIYEMEKLNDKKSIQVEFQTVPDGAIVAVDNGVKQFSPLLMTDLTEGNHQFEVSLPSYETQQHSVNLIKGHKVTVTIILGKTAEAVESENQNTESQENSEQGATTNEQNNQSTVQILSTGFFVNNQEVLRVRSTDGPAGQELGFAIVGETYRYLDETNGWFQIEFEEQPGWVSAEYSQKIASDSAQNTP